MDILPKGYTSKKGLQCPDCNAFELTEVMREDESFAFSICCACNTYTNDIMKYKVKNFTNKEIIFSGNGKILGVIIT